MLQEEADFLEYTEYAGKREGLAAPVFQDWRESVERWGHLAGGAKMERKEERELPVDTETLESQESKVCKERSAPTVTWASQGSRESREDLVLADQREKMATLDHLGQTDRLGAWDPTERLENSD